ncbi:osmotically inducible protein C [Bacteroidota bacterium]|nr:osmotically inducible protein C [Bacteroidota bacterium]
MNDHEVICEWKGNKQFNASVNNHELIMDDRFESMGNDRGPRPKPLMLTALAGCNGMNVMSVLKKMRVEVEELRINVKGELTDTDPKMYKKVFLDFHFTGKNLDEEKLHKAIQLSEEKYCGVSAMFRSFAEIIIDLTVTEK